MLYGGEVGVYGTNVIDTKAFFTTRELESKQELERNDAGNVFLVYYSRHRDRNNYDGKVSDWSEWKTFGFGVQVGFAKKRTLFEKVCGWLDTGEWKEYKTVMCAGFKGFKMKDLIKSWLQPKINTHWGIFLCTAPVIVDQNKDFFDNLSQWHTVGLVVGCYTLWFYVEYWLEGKV